MQKAEYPPLLNSIEVKGINGLTIPSIKRHFSYAGKVEEVKKLDSSVIVKFRYHRGVLKAHRLHGRILDKEPIKIRNVSSVIEEYFHDAPLEHSEKRQAAERLATKLKRIPLDLSSHWNLITHTVSEIQNEKLRWLLLELFCVKLQQIMHIYLYRSNMKSQHKQISIKELILNINLCPNIYVSPNNENVEIFELKLEQPQNLQYQSSYYNWSNDLDMKVRSKLKFMGKNDHRLNNLFYLYHILESNSLIIEEDATIIPKANEIRPYNKEYLGQERISKNIKASVGNVTESMFEVNFKEEENLGILERCCFRSIDEEHHSKEIEIISDSHFHESPVYTEIYTFFKNPFTGCISSAGVSHIFSQFLSYASTNFIFIRHYNMKRHRYIRLQFSLRLLNCQNEVLREENYFKILAYNHQKEADTDNDLCSLKEIQLAKHTLVINEIENSEKVLYMIENYAHYILTKAENYYQESEKEIEGEEDFIVILICESEVNESLEDCSKISSVIFEGKKNLCKKPKLYIICITDDDLCVKKKCYKFLENYVHKIDGEMNEEMVKLRVEQLLEEKPHQILQIFHLENCRDFIFQTMWQLYLEKSKRKDKNTIKSFLMSIRK